jgi:hypothetical protein
MENPKNNITGRTNFSYLSKSFRKEWENKRVDGKGNSTRQGQLFYG